jgi:hypothetical protein
VISANDLDNEATLHRAAVTAPPGLDPSNAIREIAESYPNLELVSLRRSRWLLLGRKVSIEFRGPAHEVRAFREQLREWARLSGGFRQNGPIF